MQGKGAILGSTQNPIRVFDQRGVHITCHGYSPEAYITAIRPMGASGSDIDRMTLLRNSFIRSWTNGF